MRHWVVITALSLALIAGCLARAPTPPPGPRSGEAPQTPPILYACPGKTPSSSPCVMTNAALLENHFLGGIAVTNDDPPVVVIGDSNSSYPILPRPRVEAAHPGTDLGTASLFTFAATLGRWSSQALPFQEGGHEVAPFAAVYQGYVDDVLVEAAGRLHAVGRAGGERQNGTYTSAFHIASDNGGQSWRVSSTLGAEDITSIWIAAAPDGTLFMSWPEQFSNRPAALVASRNHGDAWQPVDFGDKPCGQLSKPNVAYGGLLSVCSDYFDVIGQRNSSPPRLLFIDSNTLGIRDMGPLGNGAREQSSCPLYHLARSGTSLVVFGDFCVGGAGRSLASLDDGASWTALTESSLLPAHPADWGLQRASSMSVDEAGRIHVILAYGPPRQEGNPEFILQAADWPSMHAHVILDEQLHVVASNPLDDRACRGVLDVAPKQPTASRGEVLELATQPGVLVWGCNGIKSTLVYH